MKRLGIDIGIQSIGWAIYDDENQEIKAGVRIFPRGNNISDKGKESSKNQTRQTSRTIRRQNMRYKIRRKRLIHLLKENRFGDFSFVNNIIFKQKSKELYEIRKRALYEKISLTELGRIFYLLNQRRGFQSSRKDEKGNDKEKEKDLGKVKSGISELEQKLIDSECKTVGEYFYHLFEKNEDGVNADEPLERIRNRYVSRQMYLTEFDEIWKKQKEFYPNILTGEPMDDKRAERKTQIGTLFHELKHKTIFYQRGLKSAKQLVLNCSLETKYTKENGKIIYSKRKKAAPKSCFDFQTFRILSIIHNIKIGRKKESNFTKLTLDQIHILFELFRKQEKIKKSDIIKILQLGKDADLNFDKNGDEKESTTEFKGDTTSAKIYKVLGEKFFSYDEKQKNRIWELLYFASDEDWLKNQLIIDSNKYSLNLTVDECQALSKINLEPDYCRYSKKALKKLNIEMYNGKNLSEALDVLYPGTLQKSEEFKQKEGFVYSELVPILSNNELKNPLVQMAVNETIRVVNFLIKKYGKFDVVNVELARELKKPKEAREEMHAKLLATRERKEALWQLLLDKGLVRDSNINKSLLEKYELWLELDVVDENIKDYKPEFNIRKIKAHDQEKYKLWKESDRISVYTGNPIPLNKLFSEAYQVDHIIPYSRSLDDSKANKIICEEAINRAKGNNTPYEYFSEWEFQALDQRLKRIKNMPEHKKERILMKEIPTDFIQAQLVATAQVGKTVEMQLKQTFKTVNVTTGEMTAQLRKLWGLNILLNNENLNLKDRSDHRHHAIDAIVTSLITRKVITDLSTDSSFNRNKIENPKVHDMLTPHLRNQIVDILANMLVSYRAVNKAVSTRTNPYKYHKNKDKFNKNKGGEVKRSFEARGPLHEETIYGKIKNPYKHKEEFVIRKPLSYFTKEDQFEKIIDQTVKMVVKEHYEANGKKFTCFSENALKENPVYMHSTKGVKVPIKKVRISTSDKPLPVRNTSNPDKPHYVSPGNNYCLVIYEGKVIEHKGEKKGSYVSKRTFETISLLEAVQRKKNKLPIYAKTKDNLPHLMTLFKNDLVVIYENKPDEVDWTNLEDIAKNRLYRVVKFDAYGRIGLSKHNLAKTNVDKDSSPAIIRTSISTIQAIKVRINVIGELEKVE